MARNNWVELLAKTAFTALIITAVVVLASYYVFMWLGGHQQGYGVQRATTPPTTTTAQPQPTTTEATRPTATTRATPTTTTAQTPTTTPAQTAAGKREVTITDIVGRSVTLKVPVDRVVAASPGSLRLVVYLGAADKVVGIEQREKEWITGGRPYIVAHPELLQLPVIGVGGPGRLPDPELVVKVKPDVILISLVDAKTTDDLQSRTGVPVVVLGYGEMESGVPSDEFVKSLTIAATILGREKRAREIIDYIKTLVEDLANRTAGLKSPPVYVGGIGAKGPQGIDYTMIRFPPFMLVNAYNVAERLGVNKSDPVQVSREILLEWNPDYIFVNLANLYLIVEDYKRNPDFYNSLAAVRNGRVYGVLPYNFYGINVELLLADAYYIGKVLYPDRFSDIDIAKKADEIIAFFVGKPVYGKIVEELGGFGVVDLATGKVKPG